MIAMDLKTKICLIVTIIACVSIYSMIDDWEFELSMQTIYDKNNVLKKQGHLLEISLKNKVSNH